MEDKRCFYVVMRDKGNTQVSKRHEKIEDAWEEAERLSSKENDRFYVLVSFGCAQPRRQVERINMNWMVET